MSNYSEKELIPHVLKIIKESEDGVDMSSLIKRLRFEIKPDGEDTEILKNRSDDKFSQKVRNLKSHKTLENKNLADFNKGKFSINQGGLDYLWDLKNDNEKFDIIKKQKETTEENNLKSNQKILTLNILKEWPLTVRTFNALKNENIFFLGDLISYNFQSLLKLKNFGHKSLNEINELYKKFDVNKDGSTYDLSNWNEIRNELILEEKKNKINEIDIQKNFLGIKKSIFKNVEKIKDDFFNEKKIIIDQNIKPSELEKLIIDDIEYILSNLNERMVNFFCGRYGYKEKYKVLEKLGNEYGITRERVRQLEKYLNLSIVKLGKIDKQSLIGFFNKYEYLSFHKFFPKLDEFFTDTANGTGEITRDKLVVFIENFCGVKENYFKTPERELWHFDTNKLSEIFTFTPSGISEENFLEIIKDNYGYNNFVARSSITFMQNKKLIKVSDGKIYPLKLNKIYEVANILASYPEGLHWKKICKIGNNSFTKNKWNANRIVGDFSLSMNFNSFIYLSERGTYKLLKFNNILNDRSEILMYILDICKNNYREQISLDFIYKEIKKKEKYNDINFYDLRLIIKIFGKENGIYFHGKSSSNTISLNKNFKAISIKDKLKDIINNTNHEVDLVQIKDIFQKNSSSIDARLDELVEEMEIFKLNPGTYLNYDSAILLCDKDEVIFKLEEILLDNKIITNSFIREKLNEEFDYNHSIYYYNSLVKVIAQEKLWFHKEIYSSKNDFNVETIKKKIESLFNMNLSVNKNYDKISKEIGISMLELMNLRRELAKNYKIN